MKTIRELYKLSPEIQNSSFADMIFIEETDKGIEAMCPNTGDVNTFPKTLIDPDFKYAGCTTLDIDFESDLSKVVSAHTFFEGAK